MNQPSKQAINRSLTRTKTWSQKKINQMINKWKNFHLAPKTKSRRRWLFSFSSQPSIHLKISDALGRLRLMRLRMRAWLSMACFQSLPWAQRRCWELTDSRTMRRTSSSACWSTSTSSGLPLLIRRTCNKPAEQSYNKTTVTIWEQLTQAIKQSITRSIDRSINQSHGECSC